MILEMGMPVLIITGKDKGDKLNEKLEIFKHSMRFNILLKTLQKSSEGLDLSFTNHIIILELWWNPQKIFRDRKSQKNNIFIYLLCYHDAGRIIAEEDAI
jgi:SNF2 family DNA or RNA helicase